MLCKAALFEDHEIYEEISSSENPRVIKSLGRSVRGFDDATWSKLVTTIAREAVYQKFASKHLEEERIALLKTGERIIAEAAPHDRIWGIGMASNAKEVHFPSQWQGSNILGWALMQVRDELRRAGSLRNEQVESRWADESIGVAKKTKTTMGKLNAEQTSSSSSSSSSMTAPCVEHESIVMTKETVSEEASRHQKSKELMKALKSRLGAQGYREFRSHSHEFQQSAASAPHAEALHSIAQAYMSTCITHLDATSNPANSANSANGSAWARDMMMQLVDMLPDEALKAALTAVMPPKAEAGVMEGAGAHDEAHDVDCGPRHSGAVTTAANPAGRSCAGTALRQSSVGVARSMVGHIRVGNLNSRGPAGEPPPGVVDVRVDRQTPLGNPFRMGSDGHDESYRAAVCNACEELLSDPLHADVDAIAARHGVPGVDARFKGEHARRALFDALAELERRLRGGERVRLMCWCRPKRCHADGIVKVLQERMNGNANGVNGESMSTPAAPSSASPAIMDHCATNRAVRIPVTVHKARNSLVPYAPWFVLRAGEKGQRKTSDKHNNRMKRQTTAAETVAIIKQGGYSTCLDQHWLPNDGSRCDSDEGWVAVSTEHANRSVFYQEGHAWEGPPLPSDKNRSETSVSHTTIEITPETTMEAIYRCHVGGKKCAALNFASAYNPGGGFLRGSQAQEEVLSRSSTLYATLIPHLSTYYRKEGPDDGPLSQHASDDASTPNTGGDQLPTTTSYGPSTATSEGGRRASGQSTISTEAVSCSSNAPRGMESCLSAASEPVIARRNKRNNDGKGKGTLYTDDIIYSPDVVFFRNCSGELLTSTYKADVVTCACVNQNKLRNERFPTKEVQRAMIRRIEAILRCAHAHGVEALVLGAWGTGVFGNKAEDVAKWFKDAIAMTVKLCGDGFIPSIVFAIPDKEKLEEFGGVFGKDIIVQS